MKPKKRRHSGLEVFQDADGLTVIRWPSHWVVAIVPSVMCLFFISVGLLLTYVTLRANFPSVWSTVGLCTAFFGMALFVALLLVLALRSMLSKSLIVDKADGLLTIKKFLYKRVLPLGEITEVRLKVYGGADWSGWVALGTRAEEEILIYLLGNQEAQSYRHLIHMCKPGIEIIADSLGAQAVYDPENLG